MIEMDHTHTYLPTYLPTYIHTNIPTYIHTYIILYTYKHTQLYTHIPFVSTASVKCLLMVYGVLTI